MFRQLTPEPIRAAAEEKIKYSPQSDQEVGVTRGFRIRFGGPALKPRLKWPYVQADCGNDGKTRHEGRAGYPLKCLVYRKHWFV
jgi:hypothetical protein